MKEWVNIYKGPKTDFPKEKIMELIPRTAVMNILDIYKGKPYFSLREASFYND